MMYSSTFLTLALVICRFTNLEQALFSTFGSIIYGYYLFYDTYLIMKLRLNDISPEDYILGAMIIFIDLFKVFMYFLKIVGEKKIGWDYWGLKIRNKLIS